MARPDPKIVAAAIAAAVAVAAPLAQKWEGYRGSVYLDPAKILTQCYGETVHIDPSRIYSKDECAAKLRARMARDYAPALAQCMPVLAGSDWRRFTNIYGALLDAAYNAGPAAVCRKFAPAVNSGAIAWACYALPAWYITAKGVRYQGLVNRRLDERALCLKAVA